MFFDVPVSPDADTARDWAVNELSKDKYQAHGPSWWERVRDAISDFFSRIFTVDFAGNPVGAVVTILILVGLVGLVVYVVAGPVRRARRGHKARAVFDDDHRSAAEMRKAADAAADAGDWNLAVLERFRAIVRSLEERDLLPERPGMTATEAASAAGARFSRVAMDMGRAADVFDRVRYGGLAATSDDDNSLRALDQAAQSLQVLSEVTP